VDSIFLRLLFTLCRDCQDHQPNQALVLCPISNPGCSLSDYRSSTLHRRYRIFEKDMRDKNYYVIAYLNWQRRLESAERLNLHQRYAEKNRSGPPPPDRNILLVPDQISAPGGVNEKTDERWIYGGGTCYVVTWSSLPQHSADSRQHPAHLSLLTRNAIPAAVRILGRPKFDSTEKWSRFCKESPRELIIVTEAGCSTVSKSRIPSDFIPTQRRHCSCAECPVHEKFNTWRKPLTPLRDLDPEIILPSHCCPRGIASRPNLDSAANGLS